MNANFGLLPSLEKRIKDKRALRGTSQQSARIFREYKKHFKII